MKQNHVTFSAPKDQLFNLVKSLNKAEKRNFKLYAKRNQAKENLKFIQLFDILDKIELNDEVLILKKLKGVTKSKLANLKRHLYKQILSSLRLIHIQKNIDIEIREQIDFARILYGKGLYLQSLKLLDRIKIVAIDHHQDLLHLEILEFQKLIEERHITRSRRVENKVESLIDESIKRSSIVTNSTRLANLKIKIHGFYIQIGHVKKEKDLIIVKQFFKSNLASVKVEDLSVFEKIYLYQSYVWYYYILLDFESCYEYALKWVHIFEETPNIKKEDPNLYMRGYHYVLTALFDLKDAEKFNKHLLKFEEFEQANIKRFDTNSQIIAFLYLGYARLNKYYLEKKYTEGLSLIPSINRNLRKFNRQLDPHRKMVFYYKIAYMHFGSKKYSETLDYLNKITDLEMGHLRGDIQCYARLLQLLTHFELRNFELLEYLIPSVHRFLDKMEELNKVQLETIRFLKKIIKVDRYRFNQHFNDFREKLQKISKDPFEKRAFIYLDVINWVENRF